MAKDVARLSLPVDDILPALVAELEARRDVVLEATPGAGKTTRVPPALAAAAFAKGREILVLEPRRLAAKMAALRVAYEMGEPIGRTVGYQFRFENVAGPATRVRFLTEGMFIRRLLSDSRLERVAAVIIDEFHERHLQGDVALAALKRLQQTTRPDLRLVVMSATLDVGGIAAYLGGARVISVETRRHDVAVEYLELGDDHLDRKVHAAIKRAPEQGDILVFLPGVADIRRAQTALTGWAEDNDALLLPLYGDLSKEEQERALGPCDRRKVILSTNVAETSLTIPGVRVVIDGGLARIASHSYWSGLPSLRTKPISRASAIQRAGRAGREAPGHCIRLYSRRDFEARAPFETPEIRRADLAQTVLELGVLGMGDTSAVPWFEPPVPAALEAATKLLYRLGALDARNALTPLGRRMADVPTHPRLARLVLEGGRLGLAREACTLAAMLGERVDAPGGSVDVMSALERFQVGGLSARVRDQLLRHCEGLGAPLPGRDLRKALLAAFPDRVARKRELGAGVARNTTGRKVELVLASGSVLLEDSAVAAAGGEFFVTIDIQEVDARARDNVKAQRICRSLCAIEPEWLFDVEPEGVREVSDVTWDAPRERVTAVTRMEYDGLVLAETKGAADPKEIAPKEIAMVLAREAVAAGLGRFCDIEALNALLARIRFVRNRLPEPRLPELGEAGLRTLITTLCEGKSSFAMLREADLVSLLRSGLEPDVGAKLDKLAPEFVLLAKNRRVRIHYIEGQEPWIESRLQDFFGMKEGPTVLAGRVKLVLHLLAPNQRAVQVTSDLSGFWERNYPALRKELGRRYPRHAWPEDPLQR